MLNRQATDTANGDRPAAARRGPGRPTRSNAELLDLSLDLFLEHGFERTSIDAICAAAGMAKRTVYARYGDKKTLFKAALKRAIEEWIVPVEQLRALETDDLEETLLAIAQILVTNIVSPAGLRLLRLTNAESGRMPEIGAFNVKQGTEPTMEYLADLFTRHLGEGDEGLPDAHEAAGAFLALVVGGPANAAAWGVEFDKPAMDYRTRYSVRLFLHGLLPPKGVPAEALAALEDDNLRLKKLLAEKMIELDQMREGLERSA
jgi:TetR/AcrR family transcriptional regulator, mexJK operon transcriptional repressor